MALIKGTTKSGIEFQINSKIKDDTRPLYLMTKIQKCNAEDPDSIMKTNDALWTLLSLIFGSDEEVFRFQNAVADKHKGVCDFKHMVTEITEILNAANAKNS